MNKSFNQYEKNDMILSIQQWCSFSNFGGGGGMSSVILNGCASVFKTHSSKGRRSTDGSSNSRYRYLSVSAKKKLSKAMSIIEQRIQSSVTFLGDHPNLDNKYPHRRCQKIQSLHDNKYGLS